MNYELLKDVCTVRVKFSEIDAMRCVWHGNYVKYFEDGRESFNRRYPGIDYHTMLRNDTPAPIYDIQVRCLAPLGLDDTAVIHTYYQPRRGARLDFRYEIYRESDNALCCTGSTTQLFIDRDGNLLLYLPPFYEEWLRRYGIV